ncbi:MAG: hypothetical protein MdMp024_0843 [Bacteroidales bacterium]
MVASRLCFHQPVFTVFSVKMKRAVNQCKRGDNAENNTKPLVYANHIHYHEHDKQTEQPACEYEQVIFF